MNPQRLVHPSIAPLALPPGTNLANLASPYVAIEDGIWNHGEGFAADPLATDQGGWHSEDFGANITSANVKTPFMGSWHGYSFDDVREPGSPVTLLRLAGGLSPSQRVYPVQHPLYPANVEPYIDQAAFEIFKPLTLPTPQQKIVICIMCEATTGFPKDYELKRWDWKNIYPGIFSPDGLVRPEVPGSAPPTYVQFHGNTDPYLVERPTQLSFFREWKPQLPFWPILAYSVLSVPGRQTTLNEQRHLQLVAAIKALLQENSWRNPIHDGTVAPQGLTAQEIEQRVVVVFAGASNGGHQAHWSALRHPRTVHGCYAEVINPSIQRLYGEHDLGHALSRVTGGAFSGATITERDFLSWNQYYWSFGAECHDISYPRLFAQGRTYRPAYFGVGDEDITSTGTDWKRLLGGSVTSESGLQGNSSSPVGSAQHNTIAWATAENGCHQTAVAPITDPYTGQPDVYEPDAIAMQLMARAVAQRGVELTQLATGLVPPPVVVPTDRTATDADQFRGIDDPHEWHLGRGQDGPTQVPAVLHNDQAFFDAVQPDTAGANPGRREAMLIANNTVFVGSADGYVSAFQVDSTSPLAHRQRLVRTGQSPRLGNQAYAMAMLSPSTLLVGTRRHLYKLSLSPGASFLTVQQSVVLPWEVSQPHHMKVADVLPNQYHAGPEIVFASVHGGLVFYDTNLVPLCEWPEPGILDFVVEAPQSVTILSARGVVARVQFAHAPTVPQPAPPLATSLVALSRSVPAELRGPVSTCCQGEPIDLELMDLGGGHSPVALWRADRDGSAVRSYHPATLARTGLVNNLLFGPPPNNQDGAIDIATCKPDPGAAGDDAVVGEHLLVLGRGSILKLFNDAGALVAEKVLTQSGQGPVPNYYPFGADAHTLVVGELVLNTGTYTQEIVVATNTGLMWLHVNDLLGAGTSLPAVAGGGSGYGLQFGSSVQPRTNQSLSCAWAIARKPAPGGGWDPYLHVVDQRGCYWRVGAGGVLELMAVPPLPVLGIRTMSYHPVQSSRWLGSPRPRLSDIGSLQVLSTSPWAPRDLDDAVYDWSHRWIVNNWEMKLSSRGGIGGFRLHFLSGASLSLLDGSQRTMWWSNTGQWANMIEGIGSTAGVIDRFWASTQPPPSSYAGSTADRLPHMRLKSFVDYQPIMTQQSMQMVQLPNGGLAVVAGCAGGRVRILANQMFAVYDPVSGGASPQEINDISSTADLGLGAAALHAQLNGAGTKIVVWFGSCYAPPPMPQQYSSTTPGQIGNLADAEVAAGAVHRIEFDIGSGTWDQSWMTLSLTPGAPGRGAGPVGGLVLADVIGTNPGPELVAACSTGDLVVLHPTTLAVLGWTHFGGAVGHYNSMVVADLGDGEAIYIAGSLGLRRVRP